MHKLTPLFAMPFVLLLVHCSEPMNPCGIGQRVDDVGKCVDVSCVGGEVVGRTCVCPEGQVPNDGQCVPDDDPCLDFPCTDGDPCTVDRCESVDGKATCPFNAEPEGTACIDGGVTGTCQAGQCEPPSTDCNGVICDDGNPCTVDGECNSDTGECPDKTFEPADKICDGDGVCDGEGQCVECNRSQQCNDDMECTADVCNTSAGTCSSSNVDEGTQCDLDGGDGVCESGECVQPSVPCVQDPCPDDGNPCTGTVCTAVGNGRTCEYPDTADDTSCVPEGLPAGKCKSGQCEGLCVGKSCSGANDCTTDGACNPQNGECEGGGFEVLDTRCDGDGYCDGAGNCNACTAHAHCPEDSNVCTTPSCSAAGACGQQNDDGNPCDYTPQIPGVCLSGQCTDAPDCIPLPAACVDGEACTKDLCSSSGGNVSCSNPPEAKDTRCDGDGYCDGAGSCDDCTVAAHCPDVGNECAVKACQSGQCGSAPVADYTSCASGVCVDGQCGTLMPCDEEGIREAIRRGGGFTYTFDCPAKRTVTTGSTISISNPVTLDGGNKLVVKGGASRNHRVFFVSQGVAAELRNLEVTGGGSGTDGGGIRNDGTLRLVNSQVTGSRAVLDGGGIYNRRGTLTLIGATVKSNIAVDDAAGIYNHRDGTLIVQASSLVEANVAGRLGGGILNDGTFDLANSTVRMNEAAHGGGIYTRGAMEVSESAVTANKVTDAGGFGGGIRINGATVTIDLTEISDNTTMNNGAGIFNGNGGNLLVDRSTIAGNIATRFGGGVYSTAVTSILRSTISDNRALTEQGGGVRNYQGQLRIHNSTLFQNRVLSIGKRGGAIDNVSPGSGEFIFCTFWGNTAAGGASALKSSGTVILKNNLMAGTCDSTNALATSNYNVFQDDSCLNLTAGTTNVKRGVLFSGSLSDNDGPTLTVLPNASTPPINHVKSTDPACASMSTDQRGQSRQKGSGCDAGAVERQ